MKNIVHLMIVSALLVASLLVTAGPVAAFREDCVDVQPNGQLIGESSGSATLPTHRRIAVDSHISIGTTSLGLYDCSGPDLYGGASAWVGLGGIGAGSNAIVQVGYIRCHSAPTLYGDCDAHPSQLYYFWAFGGCNGHAPYGRLLWPVTGGGDHHFQVAIGTSTVYFRIDGGNVATLPKSDSAISCWINGNTDAEFYAERLDRGDTFGYNFTSPCGCGDKTYFWGMVVKPESTGVWQDISKPDGYTCDLNMGGAAGSYNRTYCRFDYGNSMSVWD
jgi:hypothetical protein